MATLANAIAKFPELATPQARAFLSDLRDSGDPIPVFAYGTVRVGGRLHPYYSDGVVKTKKEATTRGQIYHPAHYSYPVARFDEDATMVGDIIWYHPQVSSFLKLASMELGAGYQLEAVQATYDRRTKRPHRKTVTAFAFQYCHMHPDFEKVDDNDWFSHGSRNRQQSEGGY